MLRGGEERQHGQSPINPILRPAAEQACATVLYGDIMIDTPQGGLVNAVEAPAAECDQIQYGLTVQERLHIHNHILRLPGYRFITQQRRRRIRLLQPAAVGVTARREKWS